MKGLKNILAITLSGAMVFSMTACGSKKDSNVANTQTNKVVEEEVNKVAMASVKMDEAESMKGTMEMSFKMSSEEEEVDMVSESEMYIFNDPMKIRMDITTRVMGTEMFSQYYMQKSEDGNLDMYYGSDEVGWTKQPVDISYVEGLKGNADYYLEYAKDFESGGEDEINGEKTEKFVGVIKAEDINEVLANTSMDDVINSVGGSGVDVQKLFEGIEDIPMTMWISDESGYMVKFDMDMTQTMQAIMDNVMAMYAEAGEIDGEYKVNVEHVRIAMTYSDYNNVADFEIPLEVIENAVDVSYN